MRWAGTCYFAKTLNNRLGPLINRITSDPTIMGGKPCIRGLRVTVGMIVGLIAAGHSRADILKLYP